ncbi:MAG TPA: PAS domain S-box protein [Polyangia bacterium]
MSHEIWNESERAKAEAALRESEARYSTIFEKSPVGKALTRWSDRVTVSANPAFLTIVECAIEEVVGQPSVGLGIVTTEGAERALLESGGVIRDLECIRTSRSGATRILSLNADWVFVNGEKHVLTTVRDLTDLRRAETAARAHEREHLLEQARAETLRRSESKYSGILQAAADAIVSVDEQQRITFFNRAAEQAFGYAQAEVLGKPLGLLMPERLWASHREHVERFAAGAEVSRLISARAPQLYGRRKDGEEFPADATISKVTVDGKTIFTATVRDITSKLRGEVEHRLLSEIGRALASRIDETVAFASLTRLTVLELADVSTMFVAEDGRIERRCSACRSPANEWFTEQVMRLPVDRGIPHPVWEVLDTRRPLLMQVESGDLARHAVDGEIRRALERIGARSVLAVPLVIGERAQGALFVVACRPSRAFDARDVALMKEVASRVALSLENTRLYGLARKAVQARDEVLSIVAHDLRSPLGAILLQTTLTRRLGGPERRSVRPAEAIERAVSHMKRMINDLLDVAQIESGRLELDRAPVAPIELLGEVVETHRDLATKHAIELRSGAAPNLPRAWADQGRVAQVFDNLIGNAMRFSSHGTISLHAYPMGGEILFSVADTGSGIAPDDLPHVFDRFWQASRAQRGGAGLGLAIVQGIVEAHGGRAWIESKLGAGTTVFFTIPSATAATAEPRGPATATALQQADKAQA